MIKSISKLIDINADWNTGTLTDVVAVNDSLELLEDGDIVYYTNFTTLTNWTTRPGSTVNPKIVDSISYSGKALQADGGELWIYDNIEPIPYDPNKVYEISARVKQKNSGSGEHKVYIGLEGIASDGTTMINATGVDSYTSQHYIACASYSLNENEYWKTFRGYFTGNGISYNASANDPTNPSVLYTGVEYFRPMVIVNYNNGDGIVEVDYFKIREIPDTTNFALNKTVTASATVNSGALSNLVDGDLNTQNYLGLDSVSQCFVEIDLGELKSINQIGVFHYFYDNRTYHDARTEVSVDGNTWETVFDSATAEEYSETSEGKWHGLDTKKIRYIRDYLNGSTVNTGDHWVEIEAYGYPLYKTNGNRTSTTIDLSVIDNITSSSISWEGLEGLYFDGVDDYVEVSHSVDLQFSSEITIEAWINPQSYTNDNATICTKNTEYYFQLHSDGTLACYTYWNAAGSKGGSTYSHSTAQIPLDKWSHVVFTEDSTGLRKLYIDGALDSSFDMESSIWVESTSPMSLGIGGQDGTSWDRLFDGGISNVRLWDMARTQQEIQDNMNTVLTGNETGLAAYYRIDEETGTTIFDIVGTHDGTINGATWLSTLIETSVDGGSTWQTATNGSSILNLTAINTTLDVRQTLSTTDTAVTPRLFDLYWEVISSDTDIIIINCGITSSRNSPIFKVGGLSNLKGSLYWESRNSPIFKEGIDSIIKVTFLPAKWRKAIEVIRQWQTEVKPTNNWQSETKPSNIWQTKAKPTNDWQTEAKPNNTWEG